MNTWWLKGYTEPDEGILPLPPPREDTPTSATTKEPIRDAPKKISSVGEAGEKPPDLRCSTNSLQRGPSSAALDVFKRHQSLTTSSFSNLLSVEEGDRLGREKMVTPKRSITMPREVTSYDSTTELPQMKQPVNTASRHSVSHMTASTSPSGNRRMTQPNMEAVGLGSSGGDRTVSRTSATLTLAPLDTNNESKL